MTNWEFIESDQLDVQVLQEVIFKMLAGQMPYDDALLTMWTNELRELAYAQI